jgi:hypothetical protein
MHGDGERGHHAGGECEERFSCEHARHDNDGRLNMP